MTAILGIKEGQKIILASDGTCTMGNDKDPFGNQKVIHPLGSPDLLLAFTGNRGLLNDLREERNFFGKGSELTFMKAVNVIVPKLFAFCQERHYVKKDSDGYLAMVGSILLATPDSLFFIDTFGTVYPIEGYAAFGFGGQVAFSSLCATENRAMSMEERAIRAIKATIRNVPCLGYPMYIGVNDKSRIRCLKDAAEADAYLAETKKSNP
jgi:ATP-dependent protease HslVU (ClpYQ) peptidase subunit